MPRSIADAADTARFWPPVGLYDHWRPKPDQSVRLLIAKGMPVFVEVGPGKVLCGLMRQIDRSKLALNVGDEASLQKTMEQLAAKP